MFMRAPRKTPGKCAESVQIDTTPKMLENPGKSEAYAKLIGRLTGQQWGEGQDFAARRL
jgi:hypothetical protein